MFETTNVGHSSATSVGFLKKKPSESGLWVFPMVQRFIPKQFRINRNCWKVYKTSFRMPFCLNQCPNLTVSFGDMESF